jgi:hypothetical protein
VWLRWRWHFKFFSLTRSSALTPEVRHVPHSLPWPCPYAALVSRRTHLADLYAPPVDRNTARVWFRDIEEITVRRCSHLRHWCTPRFPFDQENVVVPSVDNIRAFRYAYPLAMKAEPLLSSFQFVRYWNPCLVLPSCVILHGPGIHHYCDRYQPQSCCRHYLDLELFLFPCISLGTVQRLLACGLQMDDAKDGTVE